jgi:hypothetical protein
VEGEETLAHWQQEAWVGQQGQQQRAKALGCAHQALGCQAPRPHLGPWVEGEEKPCHQQQGAWAVPQGPMQWDQCRR